MTSLENLSQPKDYCFFNLHIFSSCKFLVTNVKALIHFVLLFFFFKF